MTTAQGPFTAAARGAKSKLPARRIGRHVKTGKFYWWGTPMGLALRKRGLLRGLFAADEWDDVQSWAASRKLVIKPVFIDPTPRIHGKEANVHPKLLKAIDGFMAKQAPKSIVDIISGFRSYASQLRLWLMFQAGTGNPANRPGSSKHEATDGYKTARAVDAYVGGVAFWTWCDRKGLRKRAEAAGLRQPHRNEAWHVELAGL